MHDISKLHPIHQKIYQEFVSSEHTPNEVPDELYEYWLSVADAVDDENTKQTNSGMIQE